MKLFFRIMTTVIPSMLALGCFFVIINNRLDFQMEHINEINNFLNFQVKHISESEIDNRLNFRVKHISENKIDNRLNFQAEHISESKLDNRLNFQAEDISENEFSRIANIPVEHKYKTKSNANSKSRSLRKIVSIKSKKYKIEPSLIHSIIKVESNWNPKAVSRTGAKGLMQLMPATAKDMDVQNPFDPEENIEGGTRYLRYLLDKFNGNITFAVAAYNAGPRRIYKFKGVPPIKETEDYVKKIFSIYNNKNMPYSKTTPKI